MRIDGLLVVDKPGGMTSLDVVREIKARFFIKKAGHVGTLDPFATGVLPVVMNEGTKLVPFLREDPKDYEAVMKLGEETATDDLTGEITRSGSWETLSPEAIQTVFKSFSGRIRQTPPMFSAVKVKGKPLYRMARKGIEIERREREVQIFDLQIRKIDLPMVHFRVSCSRGTYIRALAKDIGIRIGCGAHLVSLRRTRSGPFSLDQAIPMEKVKALPGEEALQACLIPLKEVLPDFPEVIGDERMIRKVRYGKEMAARDFEPQPLPPFVEGQWLKMSSPGEGLVAILQSELRRGESDKAGPERVVLRPLRVFHPSPLPTGRQAIPLPIGEKGEGKDLI
ncbi:MAG: tRNA pseudouridine(55) synthase TruB [Deltaproteobacteria bacterium RBG_16_49_23]|nr:MAG: tRNA pseudouridine(55) synthase TruB [Deltaproteobacteria bacterium RBG_16_49_23]